MSDGTRAGTNGAPDARGAAAERAAGTAAAALSSTGAHLMTPGELDTCLGTDPAAWERFARHWDELAPDRYAAAGGTRRLRRYGQFALDPATGTAEPLPHQAFSQPDRSNPLFTEVDRHFAPLTDRFAGEALLRSLIGLLGGFATVLDSPPGWRVHVHPFRVLAPPDGRGQPTPEGLHRDGVTLVTSLLIGRDNAVGGESVVQVPEGGELLRTTLEEPGTLLLGDDRRTLHGVSPVRPADPARPARRDVLVVTLTAR